MKRAKPKEVQYERVYTPLKRLSTKIKQTQFIANSLNINARKK